MIFKIVAKVMANKIDIKSKLLDVSLDDLVKENDKRTEINNRPHLQRSDRDNKRRFDEMEEIRRLLPGSFMRMSEPDISCKLYALNLKYQVTSSDLYTLFSSFGPLRSASINYLNDGRPAGTAFIVFERRADAHNALAQLNGQILDGRTLKLRVVDQSFDWSWAQTQRLNSSNFSNSSNFERMTNSLDNKPLDPLEDDLDSYIIRNNIPKKQRKSY